jgi:hypothetical protein
VRQAARSVALRVLNVTHGIRRRFTSYEHSHEYWKRRLADGYWDEARRLDNPTQQEKAVAIAESFRGYCHGARTLHELGCGVGRNLHQILLLSPDVAISANDLDRELCYRNMHPLVQGSLAFSQTDTLTFLREAVKDGREVDVVVVSDHLIHLPPRVMGEVLQLISRFAARYILFHEAVRRTPSRAKKDYWYLHDYSALDDHFSIVSQRGWHSGPLAQEYELRVYERRV